MGSRAIRVRRHVALGVTSAVLTAVLFRIVPSTQGLARVSTATAYVGLALLCASLMLGPWNVLQRRRNPVSTNLRRDVGIWAGIVGVVHVVVGLQVHMGGKLRDYFFDPAVVSQLAIRADPFGLANYTGLVATVILVILLALSSDWSIRWFGTRRWKAIHRTNYAAFVLVAAHGGIYQLLEKRHLPFVGLFVTLMLAAIVVQVAGFRLVRTRAVRRVRP